LNEVATNTERTIVGDKNDFQPVKQSNRIDVLDALRGFAIFGIFIINIRIFSGYSYISAEARNDLWLSELNPLFDWIHIVFFSGKFYTLFSLMFGIGFALQLIRASEKNQDFTWFFSRRLFFLFLIGLIHLWAIWFSDILVFYALCGFFLIFFRNLSHRALLVTAMVLLVAVALHAGYLYASAGGYTDYIYRDLSARWIQSDLPQADPEEELFRMPDIAEVVRDHSWATIARFNVIGPLLRIYFIAYDARILRILAIFILGYWVGKNMLKNNLFENVSFLKKTAIAGYLIGLPVNIFFVEGDTTLLQGTLNVILQNFLVAIGYIALTSAYAASFILLYRTGFRSLADKLFNAVGKTALTNYILQSILGIILFYSAGLALGEYSGSFLLTLAVIIIFALQVWLSSLWMKRYRYGPLEWIWRMLTYGKYISNRLEKNNEIVSKSLKS
jgi:uncharacterized protein